MEIKVVSMGFPGRLPLWPIPDLRSLPKVMLQPQTMRGGGGVANIDPLLAPLHCTIPRKRGSRQNSKERSTTPWEGWEEVAAGKEASGSHDRKSQAGIVGITLPTSPSTTPLVVGAEHNNLSSTELKAKRVMFGVNTILGRLKSSLVYIISHFKLLLVAAECKMPD